MNCTTNPAVVYHKQGTTFSYAFRARVPGSEPPEYIDPSIYELSAQLLNEETNELIADLDVTSEDNVILVSFAADDQADWTVYLCKFDVRFRDGSDVVFATPTVKVRVEQFGIAP